MATRIITPTGVNPKSTPVEGITEPQGFTVEQYRHICETIAGRTHTLTQLLSIVQTSDPQKEQWFVSVLTDAAQIIATSIGAIADSATADSVVGNADCWNHGLSFAKLGKDVGHG